MGSPSFMNAYTVAWSSGRNVTPAGFVRKEGNIWKVLQFGKSYEQQPDFGFATREEAGQWLLDNLR